LQVAFWHFAQKRVGEKETGGISQGFQAIPQAGLSAPSLVEGGGWRFAIQ
jgi:hypothetical protein